jgi:hypothetical protein
MVLVKIAGWNKAKGFKGAGLKIKRLVFLSVIL